MINLPLKLFTAWMGIADENLAKAMFPPYQKQFTEMADRLSKTIVEANQEGFNQGIAMFASVIEHLRFEIDSQDEGFVEGVAEAMSKIQAVREHVVKTTQQVDKQMKSFML